MPFVVQVDESQADESLRNTYAKLRASFGFVPSFFQVLGVRPELAESHWQLLEIIMRDGELSRITKEMLLLVVSGINSSSYCIAAHLDVLSRLEIDPKVSRKLSTNFRAAQVDEKHKALFEFAEKLTRDPSSIGKADADCLFEKGWNERALLEAAVTVGWANLINRVAFGLGVVADP